ncbi:MAG: hypothetical protein HC769_36620 [Cyanobacteria bacterium CRU_2_1]|nr:hypothetical protein [Cyanobacteria bacterium CRU_2_1]
MKPDFEKMSFRDLRTYVLEHRDDLDALHVLFFKKGTPDPKTYGTPQTPEEWQEQEEAMRHRINRD